MDITSQILKMEDSVNFKQLISIHMHMYTHDINIFISIGLAIHIFTHKNSLSRLSHMV